MLCIENTIRIATKRITSYDDLRGLSIDKFLFIFNHNDITDSKKNNANADYISLKKYLSKLI